MTGALLDHLDYLQDTLLMPRLGVFGITNENLPGIAEACDSKNSAYALTQNEIIDVLKSRL
jgi:hypothetical protein